MRSSPPRPRSRSARPMSSCSTTSSQSARRASCSARPSPRYPTMTHTASEPATVGDFAETVRAKNAGPFWLTLDIFFDDDDAYQRVADSPRLSPDVIANEYRVDPGKVSIFRIPSIRAIKVSFPRPVTQAGFDDRDMHSGQQHLPLLRLPI